MSELLYIKNLGPIKELEIENKPFTVLVGEQAAGKSLISQLLYFFRNIEYHLAIRYNNSLKSMESWQYRIVSEFLAQLRQVSIVAFANGVSTIKYQFNNPNKKRKINLGITIREKTHKIIPHKNFADYLSSLVAGWEKDPANYRRAVSNDVGPDIYLPTGRSMFSSMHTKNPAALFLPFQTALFQEFANWMTQAHSRVFYLIEGYEGLSNQSKELFEYVMNQELESLKGIAVPNPNTQTWSWRILDETKKKYGTRPIEVASSGQMEAWPIYAMMAVWGALRGNQQFFIEEPETHLHPKAQSDVIRTMAHFTNQDLVRQFFNTTHSPFILYKINNMLQKFQSSGRNLTASDDNWLDPAKVAAYRIRDGHAENILDSETGLIDADELEGVIGELGDEFERFLHGDGQS